MDLTNLGDGLVWNWGHVLVSTRTNVSGGRIHCLRRERDSSERRGQVFVCGGHSTGSTKAVR